jgi:hypothetical protein
VGVGADVGWKCKWKWKSAGCWLGEGEGLSIGQAGAADSADTQNELDGLGKGCRRSGDVQSWWQQRRRRV